MFEARGQLGRSRERFEIGADQFGSGWKNIGRRRSPAVTIEKRRRGGVNAVAPRREDANMAPIPQVRADRGAGFIELHRHAARDQMRGGGEADRAGPDHGNRKIFENGHILSFRHY